MVMARVCAIACGHKDAIDLDRLRHDPLMKVAVSRCPQSGAPLASQSTISRLENAPRKTEAARLTAALVDQAGATIRPPKQKILDIDDAFCAAQLSNLRSGTPITTSAASRRCTSRSSHSIAVWEWPAARASLPRVYLPSAVFPAKTASRFAYLWAGPRGDSLTIRVARGVCRMSIFKAAWVPTAGE
jgi:hypothetical protein